MDMGSTNLRIEIERSNRVLENEREILNELYPLLADLARGSYLEPIRQDWLYLRTKPMYWIESLGDAHTSGIDSPKHPWPYRLACDRRGRLWTLNCEYVQSYLHQNVIHTISRWKPGRFGYSATLVVRRVSERLGAIAERIVDDTEAREQRLHILRDVLDRWPL